MHAIFCLVEWNFSNQFFFCDSFFLHLGTLWYFHSYIALARFQSTSFWLKTKPKRLYPQFSMPFIFCLHFHLFSLVDRKHFFLIFISHNNPLIQQFTKEIKKKLIGLTLRWQRFPLNFPLFLFPTFFFNFILNFFFHFHPFNLTNLFFYVLSSIHYDTKVSGARLAQDVAASLFRIQIDLGDESY